MEVRLDVSAPVVPFARELAGTPGLEPTRLYFDLHDTVLSQKAVRDITGKGAVRRVRLGQNDPKTTRVVIELSSPRPFALERRSKEVVIRFAASPMAVASLPLEDARRPIAESRDGAREESERPGVATAEESSRPSAAMRAEPNRTVVAFRDGASRAMLASGEETPRQTPTSHAETPRPTSTSRAETPRPTPSSSRRAKAAASAEPTLTAATPVRLAVARAAIAPDAPDTPTGTRPRNDASAPRAFEPRVVEPTSTDAALEERFARLHRRRDWAALLVLYASAGSPVGEAAPARVRAAVADALLAVGLPERADDVLGVPLRTEPGVVRLARAEVALARGDGRALRALLASLEDVELSAVDARRLGRLRIRAALAAGQSADAADIDAGWTAGLRRALARSTIETAEAAAAVGAFEQAAAAFRRAHDVSDAPALRAAAASGMLRAAMELSDDEAIAHALRTLAGDERTPMAQHVARSLAARSGVALDEPQNEGSR